MQFCRFAGLRKTCDAAFAIINLILFFTIKLFCSIAYILSSITALVVSGCSSFSARTPVEKAKDSDVASKLLQVKEEKLIPEARFLYDSTYRNSILSTCNQERKYLYSSPYGRWYQYSDCKFKFHDIGGYETTLNVHFGSQNDSINAVSYMELPSTKSGQNLFQIYGDGVITSKEQYCYVYGIGAQHIIKFVKSELCEALEYEQV